MLENGTFSMGGFADVWLDSFRWKEWGGLLATSVGGAFAGTLSMLGQLGVPPEKAHPWAVGVAVLAGALFTAGYVRNPKNKAWAEERASPASGDGGAVPPAPPGDTPAA